MLCRDTPCSGGLAMLLFDCCLIYVRRYIGRPRTVVLSAWDRDVYTVTPPSLARHSCSPHRPA